ncbi:IS3 family transposase [Fusobacterium varium]
MSRSAYYKWKKSRYDVSKREKENKKIEELIIEINERYNGTYGVRRLCSYINSNTEFKVNHKRIYRIMRELGVKSIIRNQSYKGKSWAGKIVDNILNRDFNSGRPLEKLCMDITEIKMYNFTVYMNAVKDVFNDEIIAYDLGLTDGFELVVKTLDKIFEFPLEEKCILHTDQGFQYTGEKYCDMLRERGITQSMSRRGNCWDNVPIEIFFGHFKAELIYLLDRGITYENLSQKIKDYITFYNNERIQLKLGGMSPVKYKEKYIKSKKYKI